MRRSGRVIYTYNDTVYNVCNILTWLRHLSHWFDGDNVTSYIHHRMLMDALSLLTGCPSRRRSVATVATEIFEMHQGTHILQVCGFVLMKFCWWVRLLFHCQLIGKPAVEPLPDNGNSDSNSDTDSQPASQDVVTCHN